MFSKPLTFHPISPYLKRLFCFAAILLGSIILTQVTPQDAKAKGKGSEKIDADSDIQLALQQLDQRGDEIQTKPGVKKGGKGFRPVKIYSVPQDWVAAGLNIDKAKEVDGKLVQTLKDGSKVTLTLDPLLQKGLTKMLRQYNVPHGAVVLVEPTTGRVLALASHTRKDPYLPDLALKAAVPSASVFKIVTAAALMQDKNIGLDTKVCYHGGFSRLTKINILGDKKLDRRCDRDLGDALAFSVNSIISKLAYQNLSKKDLEKWAKKFAYNTKIPFELPLQVSKAEFPDDPIERARAAAGFWHTDLTPLHSALISAAIANHGVMMKPTIIDAYHAPNGKLLYKFKPKVFKEVMPKKTADQLASALVKTSQSGTARKYFRFRKDFPSSEITVAGKTGTLSRKTPTYLGYTRFSGFAQSNKSDKKVAVSGVVCNTPIWHILGPYAASEGIRLFYANAR